MSRLAVRTPLQIEPGTYDLGDASSTVRTTPRRWRWITEGLDELPSPTSVVMDALVDVLGAAGGTGEDLGALSDAVWRTIDELAQRHGPRTALLDILDANHPLVIATVECDQLLSIAARSVVGGVDLRGRGRVERLARSDGGTPKAAVSTAEVHRRGLVGDNQADRAHHGRPFQAVSLYSQELLCSLAHEGHPVPPGSLGENLLVAGLDWPGLRPGVRLGVGDEVLLELSAYAPPCATIAPAFTDGRFDRVDHDKHPGWARLYAWVVVGGNVGVGDEIVVVP